MKFSWPLLVTLIFLALKLDHAIDWPWIWVFSPLWIGYAFIILFMVLFIILGAILTALK